MTAVWAAGPLAAAILVLMQLTVALGRGRGLLLGLLLLALPAAGWWLLGSTTPPRAAPADWSAVASVPADACAKCHQDHYDSWHRTFHRTMTRDASPETVKGDFANAVHTYQGLQTKFTRQGDTFYMETVDPNWALLAASVTEKSDRLPPPQPARFRVDRLVGSHWIQECLHREPSGRYVRLPVLYHITERRWVHTNGAFLAPDTDDFWNKCRGTSWNDTCLYCHNTGPSKNPIRTGGGETIGYKTTTAELGISCEACHGPGGEHVQLNQNPARRFALQGNDGDPSIVHPRRLPVMRRDEICARCHGALVPKAAAWDRRTGRDPFVAGQELTRFNSIFWTEAEQAALAGHKPPDQLDGRFWGDGTPLTTALEYNGMALSACYQNGHGTMSCLSCHAMHGDEPNFMLKPGMNTNEACFQCHGGYRDRVADHTHHAADSPGSQCFNCHMPHQVYSLLGTHRSHRIQIPDVKDSLGTGKPNACVLCHLDKSLGWVQDELGKWSNRQRSLRRVLPDDERTVSSAVLLLAKGDARTRVMVAGAFANPAAQRASGTDWFGPFLTRFMEADRYPVVRYLAHRGLLAVHGETGTGPLDYLGTRPVRAAQLGAMRTRFDAAPVRRPLPYLPLTPRGLPDEVVLQRLLKARHDPDLTINE